MYRSCVVCVALTLMLTAAAALAGEHFDIGSGTPVTILADGSVGSRETYPAFAFGLYPLGSMVWEEFKAVPCDALDPDGALCGETQFIAGFECNFSGTGCGCGGALAVPTQMQFAYDPLLVASTGTPEQSLKLVFRDEEQNFWTLLPDAAVDTENNVITASWDRNVLGRRQFAILTNDITPTTLSSWGQIKTFYRR